MKKYPEELKRKVVTEYATWEGSRREFLAKYAIPNTTVRRRELIPEVQRIFEESHGSYGADMIALKLKQEGNGADPATVRSIMKELNIESFNSKNAEIQIK